MKHSSDSQSTAASKQHYERACRLVPWGTQTNAKRPPEAFADVMPLYIERAEGCRMQDVDGRWWLDYRSALGPIILGYRHPVVDAAVRAQMEKGVLFSMASPLELTVAEQMTGLIPGLEQVRFMKTGNDANSAALRLARAYTGRDHIATCGYHGYGDWFACGTGEAPSWNPRAGNGVPTALDALVTRLPYGDLEAVERLFDEQGDRLAAVIAVPYEWNEEVAHDFIHLLRRRTKERGTVLIFDEVLTGFRLALGGAQEFFGVVPDLSTYAKAMANGYPVSAFGGRRELMQALDDVVITSTYAGETLSLAAASATLSILESEPVIEHIWEMGERLARGFAAAAEGLGLAAQCFGLPPAVQFRFSTDADVDRRAGDVFFRELYRRGIFAARPFLMNHSHKPEDVDETVEAMTESLGVVAESVPDLVS